MKEKKKNTLIGKLTHFEETTQTLKISALNS